MHFRRLLIVLCVLCAGCGRWRLVVDAVPAVDDLTEAEVLADDGAGWGAPKVALIDLTGMIVDAEPWGFPAPGENPVARFVEALRKAEDDGRVRAVVVRLNSPGGTVTASDTVYREIRAFRRRCGKPVVMLMGEVAASGAYYVACAGDRIVAQPTTVTGSIGVIIQTFNFSEGMRRIGISAEAFTSGPNKAMGSPFAPMPPEHRALLQGLVDEFYANFVDVVVENRGGLPPDDLEWIADGRVITGRRAAEVGVVDAVGDLRAAYDAAKELADIREAKMVKYHRPVRHVGSAYAAADAAAGLELTLLGLRLPADAPRGPGFYYLWDPLVW